MQQSTLRKIVLPTATSFLSYFVMSAIISPLGITSGAIAAHYDIGVTAATALFSYLTTGVLVGSFLSILLNPLFGSRRVILMSAGILALVFLLLRWLDSVTVLPVGFVAVGVCCGLLLASSAIVITAVYQERHRPSALLATDSFYSFAGFATVPIAGWVVAQSMHWTHIYAAALAVCILIVAVALAAEYPAEVAPADEVNPGQARWPLAVYLIGTALFVYIDLRMDARLCTVEFWR